MKPSRSDGGTNRAEAAFRAAFERLIQGKPIHVPRGTRISQNNVAKEAGVDPSGLKKARFPELIAEIQRWVAANGEEKPTSKRQTLLLQRSRARSLRQKIDALTEQRDKALNLLVSADQRILELTIENERLKALQPPSPVLSLKIKEQSQRRD
jgi:hypothetical protein